MKIRIKFKKYGVLKFVGHLDLLRLFQKAFRRSNIPMTYSQGFNPHQLISIGAPLPIGVTSEGEYMDIEINQAIDKEQAIYTLNKTLPEGIEIINWLPLEDSAKSSMAIINGAAYTITAIQWPLSDEETKNKLIDFMSQKEINIMKESKKKLREMNIKEGIHNLDYLPSKKQFKMFLATGSQLNVKPEFVLSAFCQFLGLTYNPFDFSVHRNELYTFTEGKYVAIDKL